MSRKSAIELDRRFWSVARDDVAWAERQRRLGWMNAPTVTWLDLLKLPCAVVLGEAGAGKTAELRRAVHLVEQQNGVGFFLPVEAVAGAGVEGSFSKAQRDAFRAWRATELPGWFLLDSVDEAKLQRRTLASALNALARELDAELPRLHVVLSSRSSDWRPADEDVVADLQQHLAGGGTAGKEADPFLFELAPLDKERIERLAGHQELSDEDREAFLSSARDADAWSFLERPLDVLAMIAYWRKHRSFGTHREVVNASIEVKLEDPERGSSLSPSRARAGARKLALAAVLSQRFALQLPGEALDSSATDALVPARILPDWSDGDIKELLTRGLFDEATYGRVRIHHRDVQEYLAAEELLRMVELGWPKRDLEALLFRHSSGVTVSPEHLQAVAAWCSLKSPDVRRRALELMPEHLLDRGDPSGLHSQERRAALLAYVDRFGKHARVYHSFDHFGLRRFACPELAETILTLLKEPGTPEHIRRLLLEIVSNGEIAQCAEAARSIALDENTPPYLRMTAMDATVKAGSAAEKAALLTLIGTDVARDRDVAARLIALLHPEHMPDELFVDLVAGQQHPKANRADRLELMVARHLADDTSPARQRRHLALLCNVFISSEPWQTKREVARNLYWLVEPLAVLLNARLKDSELAPQVLEDALCVVEVCADNGDFYNTRALDPLKQSPEQRQVTFWRRVGTETRAAGKVPKRLWDVRVPYLLRLRAEDTAWLRADCVDTRPVQDRLLAMHAIIDLTSPRDEAFLMSIQSVAAESDRQNGGVALCTALARRKAWSPTPTYAHWEVRSRGRALGERKRRLSWHEHLRANLSSLESGTDEQAIEHLYREFANESADRSERVSLVKVAEAYDPSVAEAARLGFISFWRRHEPARIEDHPPHWTPWRSTWGLIGLALDIEAGLDVIELQDVLFRRAVTYALWEMSALPSWFERCASSRSDVVSQLLGPAIAVDFAAPAEAEEKLGRLLYKLPQEPEATRAACAPQLASLLLAGDPPRTSVLEYVLKVLDGTNAIDEQALRELARRRATESELDLPRFSIWWREWVVLDADEAVTALVSTAGRVAQPEALLIRLLDDLGDRFDRRTGRGLDQLRRSAVALATLAELVDAHVPRETDFDNLASAYSAAQEVRSRLSTWLAAIDNQVATATLHRLSQRAGIPDYERAHLCHLTAVRTVADVSKAMTPDDVERFFRSPVIQPRSERELFELAVNRLHDIQYALSHDDFSVRSVFNPKDGAIAEEPVQKFLANELNGKSRDQYSVVREPEVARKKKPDIRLLNPLCPGAVTIEIKIAQSWSARELEEALASQLVQQYMNANSSNFGVYVVCSSGPRSSWTMPDGTSVNFDELIARLAESAARLVEQIPWIEQLVVVPIDFH